MRARAGEKEGGADHTIAITAGCVSIVRCLPVGLQRVHLILELLRTFKRIVCDVNTGCS